jgi:hypothetical protein
LFINVPSHGWNSIVFFNFSDLRLEVVLRSVEIAGIVDHNCLNFCFHNI